jgi:BON domain
MKFVPQVIAAKLLIIFSLVLGCQTITEMTRIESDKDAAISKAVKENFLKDKAVDLTRVDVKTTNGSVDLRGTVPSLERENMLSNSHGEWLAFSRSSIILWSKNS